jgi:tetratricopeptide (TPR) repeat protein
VHFRWAPDPGKSAVLALLLLWPDALIAQTLPPAGESDRSDPVQQWQGYIRCGNEYHDQQRFADAERCFDLARVMAGRLPDEHARLGTALSSLGTVVLEQGRVAAARELTEAALDAFRKCGAEHCGLGLARTIENLALICEQQDRLFEAEQLFREALSFYNQAGGTEMQKAGILESLGWLEMNRERWVAAEKHLRRALSLISNTEGAEILRGRLSDHLCDVLLKLDRKREAVEAARQGLAAVSSAKENRPLEIVRRENALGRASMVTGQYALAESALQRALDLLSTMPQAEPPALGHVLADMASLRFHQKRFEEAVQLQGRSIEVALRHLSADHPQIVRLKMNYCGHAA